MKLPDPTPAALNEELPDSPIASAARALPAGAWLDEFEVEEIIGEGSVAIVYAATDRALAVPVAIAEYMPARLAQRNDEAQVTPRTSAQADAFAKGLKAFINETRTLARCDHPSLVRIVRLWEANATAYRVMPRYPARRLLEVRRGMNEPPDEEALRALLDALLGALRAFHHAGGCHGKVTPSNILLLADNRPLLLGPGAAGRAIASDRIDALMTSVEPCFAPIEQIVEADIPLHPSVDLYALAGVARYWMSGQLPAPAFGAPSTARPETLADTVQRLGQRRAGVPSPGRDRVPHAARRGRQLHGPVRASPGPRGAFTRIDRVRARSIHTVGLCSRDHGSHRVRLFPDCRPAAGRRYAECAQGILAADDFSYLTTVAPKNLAFPRHPFSY